MSGPAHGVTERLARACAAHPRRTFAAWGFAVVAALVLVATSLHGLTSSGRVEGNPESDRADELISRAFPPTPHELLERFADVVIVASPRYTVDSPQFKSLVSKLLDEGSATHKVVAASSYLSGGGAPVSAGRHATLIQLRVDGDHAIKPIVAIVEAGRPRAGLRVAITGDHTVGNDFDTLSQRDLEHGELVFGLPAALIVLVLVFGAVVAGLVPVPWRCSRSSSGSGSSRSSRSSLGLSVFIVNMLSGMGLALGIDYSLFVISRYREERTAGLGRRTRRSRFAGATASRAVLFSGSTFVVALFGMLLVPTSIMRSLADRARSSSASSRSSRR